MADFYSIRRSRIWYVVKPPIQKSPITIEPFNLFKKFQLELFKETLDYYILKGELWVLKIAASSAKSLGPGRRFIAYGDDLGPNFWPWRPQILSYDSLLLVCCAQTIWAWHIQKSSKYLKIWAVYSRICKRHLKFSKYANSLCYKSPQFLVKYNFHFPKLYLFFYFKTFLFSDIPQNFKFLGEFFGNFDSYKYKRQ